MTDNRVNIGLVHDEILAMDSTIAVDVPGDALADEVFGAISVPGVEGEVIRDEAGRFVWTPCSNIPPGQQTFVLEALTDASLNEISRRIEIPFHVVATRAQLPASLRVESFTRMRLTPDGFERLETRSIPEGEFIDVLKAVNRDDGRPVSLGYDQSGQEIDGELQLQEHRIRLVAARGKQDFALQKQLFRLAPEEGVLIDAWFFVEEPEPVSSDRPQHDDGALAPFGDREIGLIERIQQRAREIVGDLGAGLAPEAIDFRNPEDRVPVLTLRVPSESVSRVAQHQGIKAVFLHEERGILDLARSIFIARSDLVHQAGQTGEGVRVAVWEEPPFSTPNLDTSNAFNPAALGVDLHSTAVHDIIRNKGNDAPPGHAPGCFLVSANSVSRAALTWAVGAGQCSIINQSFHRPGEASASTPSSDDNYNDWLASHWPYPLIVQAAGNIRAGDEDAIDPPELEYVNHKGYNALSVASHGDDALSIDPMSVFRNPSTPHGDRELPEISANGTSVNAEAFEWGGTSFAAPAVSGVASLIQGTSAVLRYWPEGCRAILLASAGPRVSGSTWWQDIIEHVDAADGAGALNAEESYEVAKCRSSRDAAPTARGWDIGLLTAPDFDANLDTVFSYQISVPSGAPSPVSVRVCVAWTSLTGRSADYWSSLAVDLDLSVYDASNVRVGFSGSWDNSYEIVQFIGIPGETYTIKIRNWSPLVSTWYGIAWTAGGSIVSMQRPPMVDFVTGGG